MSVTGSELPEFTQADVLAARQELAKRSLSDFAQMVEIPTKPVSDDPDEDVFETLLNDALADHHALILDAMQRLADGEFLNLMLLCPPGSAKSTYADVVFVPWFMSRKPRQNVILASYGSDLVRKQGRRARQLVRSRSFGNLFPDIGLSTESSAADEWALSNGSEFMAGGILSGITGNRSDLNVIDDPVKGREEAESETIRKKTREAYDDDLRTRLKPGGRTLLIQTRWHGDDLAGSILPEDWSGESGLIECRDGQRWYVLCIPAKAERADDPLGREPGEYLWPEWFPEEHWKPFEKNARTWSSLYQQRPAPEEGTYFKRDWFEAPHGRHEPFSMPFPSHMRLYGWSDFAVTEDDGDFTEHGVWALDHNGKIYQVDWWFGQTSSDQWIESMIDMMALYCPRCWFGEGGVIEKAVKPMLLRRMRERQVRCRTEWIPSVSSKTIRARGIQSRAAMGEVSLLNDDRGERVLKQLLEFPAGRYDDAVDVCSGMGLVLDQAHPALAPEEPDKKEPIVIAPPTFEQLRLQKAKRGRRRSI